MLCYVSVCLHESLEQISFSYAQFAAWSWGYLAVMNEGGYIYGATDLRFFIKWTCSSLRTGGRAVVQTPVNRLMAQQAPCICMEILSIIIHVWGILCTLSKLACSGLFKGGQERSVKALKPTGTRARCRLWLHEGSVGSELGRLAVIQRL